MPAEIRAMAFTDARAILSYWHHSPPENEMLALLAQCYTTWRPTGTAAMTREEHQRSLEQRWASGAMNAKQIFESMGGNKNKSVAVSIAPDGGAVTVSQVAQQAAGIGPFPGAH
jgi:hypothetical protein